MHRLARRLFNLERSRPDKRTRIVWNNHDEATADEVRRLEAQGFNVMLVGWMGRPGAQNDAQL